MQSIEVEEKTPVHLTKRAAFNKSKTRFIKIQHSTQNPKKTRWVLYTGSYIDGAWKGVPAGTCTMEKTARDWLEGN